MTDSILNNYFSETEIANFLGIKTKTLKTYRSSKKGMGKEFLKVHPPFIKYGRKIYFPKEQFDKWFQERQGSFENKELDFQIRAMDQFKEKRRNTKALSPLNSI